MFAIRTDLAEELRDHAMTKRAKDAAGEPDGVTYQERLTKETIRISTIDVTNEAGEVALGKKRGRYVTISYPTASGLDYANFISLCDVLADELKSLCGTPSCALVCGLGNRNLAADAIGVLAAESVLATHHLCSQEKTLFKTSGLFDLATISPGVMAKTGLESASLVGSAVQLLRPDLVIAVDSLAAREVSRLARTIQLCNTGIAPGSGIGNRRAVFDEESLGVPVIAIGVPTVVDTATLVRDAMGENAENASLDTMNGLFVSPKEIDLIAANMGKLIGYAINRSFHGNFSYEEMAMMA